MLSHASPQAFCPGYLLSKKEGRVGTPERPLSALGELSYYKYWTLTLMLYLRNAKGNLTLEGQDELLLESNLS